MCGTRDVGMRMFVRVYVYLCDVADQLKDAMKRSRKETLPLRLALRCKVSLHMSRVLQIGRCRGPCGLHWQSEGWRQRHARPGVNQETDMFKVCRLVHSIRTRPCLR